jgi:hypothetical protein
MSKNKYGRILAVCLVITMLFVLSSCGSKDSTNDTNTDTENVIDAVSSADKPDSEDANSDNETDTDEIGTDDTEVNQDTNATENGEDETDSIEDEIEKGNEYSEYILGLIEDGLIDENGNIIEIPDVITYADLEPLENGPFELDNGTLNSDQYSTVSINGFELGLDWSLLEDGSSYELSDGVTVIETKYGDIKFCKIIDGETPEQFQAENINDLLNIAFGYSDDNLERQEGSDEIYKSGNVTVEVYRNSSGTFLIYYETDADAIDRIENYVVKI